MKTIGDIILTLGSDLLRIIFFGRKSLNELRGLVKTLCLPDAFADEQDTIDYSSYDEMITSFIGQCIKNKRDQQLLKYRFCFTEGKAPVLEELELQFGITRERVRQILKKGLGKLQVKANLGKLNSFGGNWMILLFMVVA